MNASRSARVAWISSRPCGWRKAVNWRMPIRWLATVPSERFLARRCRSNERLRLAEALLSMAGPQRSDASSIRHAAPRDGRRGRLERRMRWSDRVWWA
jgi:hypothetical protein